MRLRYVQLFKFASASFIVTVFILFILDMSKQTNGAFWRENPMNRKILTNCDGVNINSMQGLEGTSLHQIPKVGDRTMTGENGLLRSDEFPLGNQDSAGIAGDKQLQVSGHIDQSKQTIVNDADGSMTSWEREQISRKKKLHEACEKTASESHHRDIRTLGEYPHLLLRNFLVDDEHGILYCYVPKVACTQWKRVMLHLTGSKENAFTMPHSKVHAIATKLAISSHSFTEEEIMKRLTTYKTIMFTRHPLERILSAYKDKFERNTTDSNAFIKSYGKQMLNKIHRKATFLTKTNVSSLTFQDMLEFLGVNPPAANQEHWKPAYHLCHPCTIDYTYIGSFDDLLRDSTEILSKIVPAKKVRFPEVKPSSTAKLLPEYLSQVPPNVTDQFRKIFRLDHYLFGYL